MKPDMGTVILLTKLYFDHLWFKADIYPCISDFINCYRIPIAIYNNGVIWREINKCYVELKNRYK